jgi:hypothetical protein
MNELIIEIRMQKPVVSTLLLQLPFIRKYG